MPLLYYWRPDNYARDRSFGFGFHLNQNSPAMVVAQPGDSLWAFTRRRDGLYVLAAELVVRAVTHNPPSYRYGRWRIWGDLQSSRYFDIDAGARVESLVRALGVSAGAERLGQSFQGHAAVREISHSAHHTLESFARDLPVLPRVAIYPEDEFEARVVYDENVHERVIRDRPDEDDVRLRYLYDTVNVRRLKKHVEALQELYQGRCQICRYNPRAHYGHSTCEGHHIQWLSRGGEDDLDNMVLICPNHHRVIHRDDAPFDFLDLAFTYANGLHEGLMLNSHLPAAVA